jgi:hypothetical protein
MPAILIDVPEQRRTSVVSSVQPARRIALSTSRDISADLPGADTYDAWE